MTHRNPHVVIVGAGFGGLKAARELYGAKASITLIDRSNHHLFQPLLYQVATAGLSPADIGTPIRQILSHQKNTVVMMTEVDGVDLNNKKVLFQNRKIGSVKFDYLVLATGASHSYFGHNEWSQFAPGLKSIDDAIAIRRKLLLAFESAEIEPDLLKRKALLTFILVGAGPTGVEMAGSVAELAHATLATDFRHIDPRSAQVILIEAGPRILSAFSENLAKRTHQALERVGVRVRVGARVESIHADGVIVSGEKLYATNVIWCAGVVASPVGKWLGADAADSNIKMDKVGRIKVAKDLSVPGYPDVFVIGDAAYLEGKDGRPLPGVAAVALQQGKYVADVIKARLHGAHLSNNHATSLFGCLPPFDYIDKGNLATVGRAFAVAEIGKFKLSGFPAWLAWVFIHIYYLIGFRNRILVLTQWAWAYFTFSRSARLITGEKK